MDFCMEKESYFAGFEGMGVSADWRDAVVCPKPRWLSPIRPWEACDQIQPSDSEAAADILDNFLAKGWESDQAAASPPFFSGSPPRRSSNPIIHDACFGDETLILPFMPVPLPSSMASSASESAHKSCSPTKYGLQPAAMRIEGFDCLNHDRRGCGITAIA